MAVPEPSTLAIPTHATQLIFPRVRTLAKVNPITAATATKTAVQAACTETALRPMERPRMPDPAMNIQTAPLLVEFLSL